MVYDNGDSRLMEMLVEGHASQVIRVQVDNAFSLRGTTRSDFGMAAETYAKVSIFKTLGVSEIPNKTVLHFFNCKRDFWSIFSFLTMCGTTGATVVTLTILELRVFPFSPHLFMHFYKKRISIPFNWNLSNKSNIKMYWCSPPKN
jgi:hypothetical protein